MSLHFSTNFETQKYYENEANFNGVYSSKGWGIYNKSIRAGQETIRASENF